MTFLLLLSPTSPAGVREIVEAHGEVLYETVGRYKEEHVKKSSRRRRGCLERP